MKFKEFLAKLSDPYRNFKYEAESLRKHFSVQDQDILSMHFSNPSPDKIIYRNYDRVISEEALEKTDPVRVKPYPLR